MSTTCFRTQRTRLTLLFALAPLHLAVPASAQEFEITDALLTRIADESRPAVREALAVELASVPVRLASRKEIESALVAENTPLFEGLGAGDEAGGQARGFAQSISPFLLAKYAFAENEVLVQATAFSRLAELVDVPELASEEALRAVILHELVHAADDERHDLPSFFASCKTADAVRVRNAVLEGHAQLVARDLAQRLGCSDGFDAFTLAVATPAKLGEGEGMELMSRAATSFMAFNYITGEAFLRALWSEGGDDAVRRAFTSPPIDPVVVANPAWFLHPEQRPQSVFELGPALDGVASVFEGMDDWTLSRVSVSPTDLTTAMAPLPEDEIEAIAATLRQSLVQVAVLGHGESQFVLGLFEFGSPEEAVAYREAYARLQHLRDDLMKDGTLRIVSAEYADSVPPHPAGVLIEKRIAAGDVEIGLSAICVSRGPLVVEGLASDLENCTAEALLEAAVETLDGLTNAKVEAR